jgi:GDPmannose 4,6-dehydratase
MKKALITGITGQTGSYLAELLLEKGYEVHGIVRRLSIIGTERIDHIYKDLHLHYGDMTDGSGLAHTLTVVRPDEIYNLAAQSHVKVSFDQPIFSVNVDGLGVLRLFEAARDYQSRLSTDVRIYQAGTSEMFGSSPPPQNEGTPFHPRSPYACAKVYAHHQAINYREAYNMFIANGILFNHESERRGETFVTRKITLAAARIKEGLQDELVLGNLDAKRDWGYAPEYAEAMWMMLQADEPGDFVVATGETHTVKEFVEAAFNRAGLDWTKHVKTDPRYLRPSEVEALHGSPTKIKNELGWKPRTKFTKLVELMVEHDMEIAKKEAHMQKFNG